MGKLNDQLADLAAAFERSPENRPTHRASNHAVAQADTYHCPSTIHRPPHLTLTPPRLPTGTAATPP